jgi:purine-binding chemotaxis protein CheW
VNEPVLLVRAGPRACALALGQVEEVMRPLPVARLGGAPAFVRGASVIRGAPVPVVDLATLLGIDAPAPGRFVTLRLGPRRAALAVTEVMGVRDAAVLGATTLPPLFAEEGSALAALARLDRELLVVLRGTRLLPEGIAADPTGEAAR